MKTARAIQRHRSNRKQYVKHNLRPRRLGLIEWAASIFKFGPNPFITSPIADFIAKQVRLVRLCRLFRATGETVGNDHHVVLQVRGGLQDHLSDAETEADITAQIEAAAADDALHWVGKVRSLYVVTDGLESSIYWTKALHLKEPTPNLLSGVQAEYFEVGNPRSQRLQTPQLRDEWKNWLTKAGADVRMDAPGYPSGPYKAP